MEIYKDLNPKDFEINPAKKEIWKLIKGIRKANTKGQELVGRNLLTEKKLEEFQQRMQTILDEIDVELTKFANIAPQKSFLAGEDLADYFIKGQQKVLDEEGNVKTLFDIQPRDRANPKYMETINSLKTESLKDVKAITGTIRDNVDRAVRKSMDELLHPSVGPNTLAEKIENILLNEGIKITDSRGRLWNPTAYSKMYARTRTREYQTAGTEYRMNEVGMDLVKISEHVDVDGMDICNEYEGNVYSLSGKHKEFPALSEHTPFHPNCAHVETPWSEKYHNEEPKNRLGLEEQKNAPATAEELTPEQYKELQKQWEKGMDAREYRAIQSWTDSNYTPIRKLQQGTLETNDIDFINELGEDLKYMNLAYEKAPKFKGTVYRGIEKVPDEVRNEIWNSKTMNFNTFTSTSKSKRVAQNFGDRYTGLLFEFQDTRTGVDIHQLSNYKSEDEILFPKGTKFEVIGRTEDNGFKKMILRQVLE